MEQCRPVIDNYKNIKSNLVLCIRKNCLVSCLSAVGVKLCHSVVQRCRGNKNSGGGVVHAADPESS